MRWISGVLLGCVVGAAHADEWRLRATWTPVPDVPKYKLQWWVDDGQRRVVDTTKPTIEWAVQAKSGQTLRARVRSCADQCGPWGETTNVVLEKSIALDPPDRVNIELIWRLTR
jgi:hypothetical protein